MMKKIHDKLGIKHLIVFFCVVFALYSIKLIPLQNSWKLELNTQIASSTALPKDFHSLTLHDDSIYFSGLNTITYALDAKSGMLRWKHEAQNYSNYQMVFDESNRLFTTNFDGNIYALDKKSGNELWRYTTPDRTKIDTEAIIAGNSVLFGSRNGNLYSLEKDTGKLKWIFSTKQIDKSLYLKNNVLLHFGRINADSERAYIMSATEKKLYAVDLKNGTEVWQKGLDTYYFENPSLYEETLTYWDSSEKFKIVRKNDGSIVATIKSQPKRLYEGKICIYIINSNDSIDCINPNNGSLKWTYDKSYNTPLRIIELNSNTTYFVLQNMYSTIVTAIETGDGIARWSHSFGKSQDFIIFDDSEYVFLNGDSLQCKLTKRGDIVKCINLELKDKRIFNTNENSYFISKGITEVSITNIDKKTWKKIWELSIDDINIDSLQTYLNYLYFTNKENSTLYKVASNYPSQEVYASDLRTTRLSVNIISRIRTIKDKILFNLRKGEVALETGVTSVPKNGFFEITIHSGTPQRFEEKSLHNYYVTMISPSRQTYTVKGFYFDLNTWKFIFRPQEIGEWYWKTTFAASNTEGSFVVTDSGLPGNLTLSSVSNRYFTRDKEKVFIPIGLQNCSWDLHHDGNPLQSWPLDEDAVGSDTTMEYKTTSMDKYVQMYAQSGFNLYRWGADNCSFPLWNFDKNDGFGPKVNEGIFLDEIFKTLKKHNYSIWMSLFSFKLPFEKPTSIENQERIRIYLDYIVSRYAAYVDVWELANEINLDESLITFMSGYIKSIDPYKHPITTSWERPELKEIDTVSAHWYGGECNEHCDQDIWKQIEKFEKYNKPLVFSEQGNNESNWDEYSGERYRIRLWMSFLMRTSLIFWNMPNVFFENKTGPSNIYIGPTERGYTSVFSKIVADIGDDVKIYDIASSEPRQKVYSVISNNRLYGYVYSHIYPPVSLSTKLTIDIPFDSTIQWINPLNGEVIGQKFLTKGVQTFATPSYITDIIFKIAQGK